jgi:hypothetical protein
MRDYTVKIKLVVVILALMALTACSNTVAPEEELPVGQNEVRVAPMALFEGEEKKYEPFFGFMTGAVRVDYAGNKQVMELGSEIWHDGKKTEELGGGAIFFDEDQMKGGYHGEVIINMKERVMPDKTVELDVMMSMNGNTGSSTVSYPIAWDPALKAKSIIGNPTTTYTVDSAVPIWGIQATSTGTIRPTDFSPENLAHTEYALIFTVRFLDRSEFDSSK